MRRLVLPFLVVLLACGDDDAGSGGGVIPPGATVAPGDLPSAALFTELKGTDVGIAQGFACAITLERKVICWGELKYQQLLQLNALGKTAIEVKLPSAPKSLAMGGDGACAIVDDGSVRCWGSGIRGNTGAGQIGSPDVGESVSIAGFPGPVEYLHLGESNGSTTCAISGGHPYCWDLGRDDGARELDGGVTDAKLVASSNDVHCVVRADNKLYCWGANDFSALGIPIGGTGTNAPARVTTPTEVPDLTDVTAVEAGGQDTCAVSKGNVYCWGGRWYAGMKEEERQAAVPKQMVQGLSGVTKLRRNGSYFCAIANSSAYCWSGGSSPIALKVDEPGATDIALSSSVTRCGVFADNRVKCWGSASAIMGDGAFQYHPIPTFVPGVAGAAKLFTDSGGACVLDKDNHASCWGDAALNVSTTKPDAIGDGHAQRWPALDNASFIGPASDYQFSRCGVFGGTIKCAAQPTETAPTPFKNLTNVADFAMSGTVGCARLTDGTVSCWTDKREPTPVAGLASVNALVMLTPRAGSPHPCVLLAGAGVLCLSNIPFNTPAQFIQVPPDYKLGIANDLRAGNALWCGLTPNGVACDIDVFGPTELRGDISGTSGASLLAVGDDHACALAGGRVQCWGSGQYGQLGSGQLGSSKAAFPVSNAGVPVAMSAGSAFTCGLQGDGRVQCWGSNATGIVSTPPTSHPLPNQVRVLY